MGKFVLVFVLAFSTPAHAFNAIYNEINNLLTINGLEYRGRHYDIDLINTGDYVFVIDDIKLTTDATAAYYDNDLGELVFELLYKNQSYRVILKKTCDFSSRLQEAKKLIIERGFEDTWEGKCTMSSIESMGIYNAGSKSVLTIDAENLIDDEYWYVNSNCSGSLIFRQKTIYDIYHKGQTTTLDNHLVEKIKTEDVEVKFQIFDQFLLSLLSDDVSERCGFTPEIGQPTYASKCSPNLLGEVAYRIYKIDSDVLYLITKYDEYPKYMPIESVFFFDKYSRASSLHSKRGSK